MITDLEFVQYTSAKICHDLAGALGAIANGIEFVGAEDPEMQKKALELIRISSSQAIDTMKLFRQIYGIIKHPAEADLGQMKEACQMILKDKNITLEFLIPQSLPIERMPNQHTTQIMLGIVGLVRTQLIHGGTITLTIQPHGDHNSINIIAKGREMKIKSDNHKIIQGEINSSAISSSNIDAYYISRLREEMKSEIKIIEGHDKVEYIIAYHA